MSKIDVKKCIKKVTRKLPVIRGTRFGNICCPKRYRKGGLGDRHLLKSIPISMSQIYGKSMKNLRNVGTCEPLLFRIESSVTKNEIVTKWTIATSIKKLSKNNAKSMLEEAKPKHKKGSHICLETELKSIPIQLKICLNRFRKMDVQKSIKN